MVKYDIFISYRREGGEAMACLLCDKLRQREFKVFYDVESLRSGKFNDEIYDVIHNCTDVICVLPENALDRCQDEEDWVRREIAYAIAEKKNIVPVKMRNFEYPNNLPEDIKEIKNYQTISANMEFFDATFQKLLEALRTTQITEDEESIKYTNDLDTLIQIRKYKEEIRRYKSPSAMYKLALIYYQLDNYRLDEDVYRLCLKASDSISDAQVLLGDLLMAGRGIGRNVAKAIEYYFKAVNAGNSNAYMKIVHVLENQSEREQLIYNLVKASVSPYNKSDLYEVTVRFGKGIGVPIDIKTADKCLEMLPEDERKKAMWEIAEYHNDWNHKKTDNYEIADYYFTKLVELGEEKAGKYLSKWYRIWRSVMSS